jgi:hypothetical protein
MKDFAANTDFNCVHCRNFVSAGIMLSSVNHRNHCPYCLWSRHMDLFNAGDRMSACKTAMEPVGLTMKRVHKKYPAGSGGELMLIHRCTGCGAISINRIAADDDKDSILEVYSASLNLPLKQRRALTDQGIEVLDDDSRKQVRAQLFGWASKPVFAEALN